MRENEITISHHTKTLSLATPQVMAIINATPDSFSDGGKHLALDNALRFAEHAVTAGATILDIGGESTRPNALPVDAQTELERTIPLIEAIRARFDCWISIDTSKAIVMRDAVNAGANLINDVHALQAPNALETAASLSVPVCLMHMQGSPTTMQEKPEYRDILRQIEHFFQARIRACEQAGIARDKLILDPGFGFGKTLAHNYQLLANFGFFQQFGLPLLAGISRKSMIFNLLNKAPTDVLAGSVAAATVAAMQGARIIRVHDVQETVDAMQIVRMLQEAKEKNNGE